MRKRLVCFLLAAVLAVGLLPGRAVAAEGGSDKLAAPQNVRWETESRQVTESYTYSNGSVVNRTYNVTPGWISWNQPETAGYSIIFYNDANERVDKWSVYSTPANHYYRELFSVGDRESGSYRFSIQLIDRNNPSRNSEVVYSDYWTYTRPASRLSTPTNLHMDGTTLQWDGDANASGSYVECAFSETETGEREVSGNEWWFGGSSTEMEDIANVFCDGDGYYHVRVRSLSSDITTICHSEWSDYLTLYVVDGVVVSGGSGGGSPGGGGGGGDESIIDSGYCGAQGDNLAWTLYSDGVLIIEGEGEMKNYYGSDSAPWSSHENEIKETPHNDAPQIEDIINWKIAEDDPHFYRRGQTKSSRQAGPVSQNQICQRKHDIDFCLLFSDPSVSGLFEFELTLHNPENVFHLRSD